jgi:voltage-dependent anion channel protein 2
VSARSSLLRFPYACIVDLLTDDYTSKISLKCKKNAGPVTVTIETEQGDGGSLSSKIGTKFSYAKFNCDKGQLKADGGRLLETSLKLTPDVQLSFKTTKGADLGVDYTKGNFYATGLLDVMNMSNVSTSACMSLPSGLKIGGAATYSLSGSKGLSGVNAGASYKHGPVFASLTATSKFSQYNIGLNYNVNSDISLASQTTHTSTKVCDVLAIGGAYKNASIGTIKAKVGSNGIVHACLIREIAPKVTLTASGSMSPSDPSTFKPGFGISM